MSAEAQAAVRARRFRLQAHVECVLLKPSTARFASFEEVAGELRALIAVDISDDEIIMAARLVRAQWRQWWASGTAPRSHFTVIEENYRWLLRNGYGR